ncbi:hypothetical protein PLICRDRAFT_118607, partial [Plicaturopsis crispa FD-325 SS-3]
MERLAAAWDETPAKTERERSASFANSRAPESQRTRDPFDPERVQKILDNVSIGADITAAQRREVQETLAEFADVFALDLAEVLPVDFVTHKLNVDPDAKLPRTRASQPGLTAAQKSWYYDKLDEMEKAGIVARVQSDFVKCVS